MLVPRRSYISWFDKGTALNCTALHCIALHCTALHCNSFTNSGRPLNSFIINFFRYKSCLLASIKWKLWTNWVSPPLDANTNKWEFFFMDVNVLIQYLCTNFATCTLIVKYVLLIYCSSRQKITILNEFVNFDQIPHNSGFNWKCLWNGF